jgi:beta-glucanase (GH16 family)
MRRVKGLAIALAAFGAGWLGVRAFTSSAPPDWRLVWHDEFDGQWGQPFDPAAWHADLGRGLPGGPVGWGNNEAEAYTADPANVEKDGAGNLRLTATKGGDGQWHSARLETVRSDFAPPRDGSMKVEAQITLPGGGMGYWPAFWMLGAQYRDHPESWPVPGEIDVMENVDSNSQIHGTLHCDTRPDAPCHSKQGIGHTFELPAPAGLAGSHLYTLIWDTHPKRLRWQVDGQTYGEITPAVIGSKAWDATFSHGYFLLLNLAVGGDWPGQPNQLTIPGASMSVDYVRVWTAL